MNKFKQIILALFSVMPFVNAEKILIESVSPNFGLIAILEQTKDATYLYLLKDPRSILGSVWIRNHKTPHKAYDPTELMLKNGQAPLLPLEFCKYTTNKPFFNIKDIKIIWIDAIEESENKLIGEHAVLLEQGEILGIIPYWTSNEVSGFSVDCKEHSFLTSPLNEDNALYQKAKEYLDRSK